MTTGASVPTNHNSFRNIAKLEIRSSYSYQQSTWLADIKPELLSRRLQTLLLSAKKIAHERRTIERELPHRLLFKNHGGRRGWPASQPSIDDCQLLATARQQIAKLLGHEIEHASRTNIQYLTASTVYQRYEELIATRPSTFTDASNATFTLNPIPNQLPLLSQVTA